MFKITKSFRKANIPKTIRFTEELDDMLLKIAEKEEISFNELDSETAVRKTGDVWIE